MKAGVRRNSDPTYPDWVISTTQIVAYLLAGVPLRMLYRARRIFPRNIETLERGVLVVANHQSMVDPFIIVFSLPFRLYLKMLPLRFPTAHHIFTSRWYNPRFFPFLKLLGCFTIGTTSAENMHVIFYMREKLAQGYTFCMFPEGGINEAHTVKDLKRGVDFFMKHAKKVLFVRLHGFNDAVFARSTRRIVYGEVFDPPPEMSVDEMRSYLENL